MLASATASSYMQEFQGKTAAVGGQRDKTVNGKMSEDQSEDEKAVAKCP